MCQPSKRVKRHRSQNNIGARIAVWVGVGTGPSEGQTSQPLYGHFLAGCDGWGGGGV